MIQILKNAWKYYKVVIIGVLIFIGLVLGGLSVTIVPSNSVGIKYNRLSGNLSEVPLSSGLHFKKPFVDRTTSVSTEMRSADVDDLEVTTKDAQTAKVDIEIQYLLAPEDAIETYRQFNNIPEEEWIKVFVYQQIHRGVQEASSNFTVSELRGDKRGEFQVEVDKYVKDALESNRLTMHSTSVDNIKVSEGIAESIEKNAKAKQDVETAKQNRLKQEVENETAIEKEKAEAEVKKIRAEAEANANKKLSEGITSELIEYIEAEARKEHGWYKYNNMEPTIVEEGK